MTQEMTQYEEDGYAIFRDVLDSNLIQECHNHIDWLADNNPNIKPEEYHHTLMTHDPFWVRLISDERLLAIAEQFVGSDLALFSSHYICKPAKTGRPVLWHQDGSYWPLEPVEVVTLWLAVDPSVVENGCLRVIPKTHRQSLKEMKARQDIDSVLGSAIDDTFVDESKAVDLILNPGDVSVHHPNLIHGSNANTSEIRRCGLTIRYIPTTTKITDRSWPAAFHLKGKDHGLNNYQNKPKYVTGKHMTFEGCEDWA